MKTPPTRPDDGDRWRRWSETGKDAVAHRARNSDDDAWLGKRRDGARQPLPPPVERQSAASSSYLAARGIRTTSGAAYLARKIPGRDDDLATIQADCGPILAREDAPVLYETLHQAFETLSRAQEQMASPYGVSVNEFFIVDSEESNAFVVPRREDGVSFVHNMAFVTTALIKELIGDDLETLGDAQDAGAVQENVRRAMLAVVGVLAHELAHPLDTLDDGGLDQTWGARSSQAAEIRADAEGTALLRKAGYPQDCLYLALQKLLSTQSKGPNALEAAVSTHPTFEVRLSSLRLLMTLERYENGESPASSSVFDVSGCAEITRELSALALNEQRWKFTPPKDFDENLARLVGIARLKGPLANNDDYRATEFTRLFLHLDEWLYTRQRKGVALTPDEQSKLRALFKEMLEKPGKFPSILTFRRKKGHQGATFSPEMARHRTHQSYMGLIDYYSSPEHLKLVTASLFRPKKHNEDDSKYSDRVEVELASAAELIPQHLLFQALEPRLAAQLKTNLKLNADGDGSPDLRVRNPDFNVRVGHMFLKDQWQTLTDYDKIMFFGGYGTGHVSFPPEQGDLDNLRSLIARLEKKGDKTAGALKHKVKEIYEALWRDRGFLGTLGLITCSPIDWHCVFDALQIDHDTGTRQIRQAVQDFTKTKRYADMVSVLASARLPGSWPWAHKEMPDRDRGEPWLDETLYPYLIGTYNAYIRKSPRLSKVATLAFGASYLTQGPREGGLVNNPERFRAIFGRHLGQKLREHGRGTLSASGFWRVCAKIAAEILPEKPDVCVVDDILASVIDESLLTAANKQTLLREVFVQHGDKEGEGIASYPVARWAADATPKARDRILKALKKYDAIQRPSDLFQAWKADYRDAQEEDDDDTAEQMANAYLGALNALTEDLVLEIRERSDAKSGTTEERSRAVFEVAHLLDIDGTSPAISDDSAIEDEDDAADERTEREDPILLISNRSLQNSARVRELKAEVLGAAKDLGLDQPAAKKLFRAVTRTGPARASDAFFRDYLERHATLEEIESYLSCRSIADGNLCLALARRVLEADISALRGSGPGSTLKLSHLVALINHYVPKASLAKDAFLEELAWRFELEGAELKAFVEDQKGTNWRRGNAMLVNATSAVVQHLSGFDGEQRRAMIAALLATARGDVFRVPANVIKSMEKSAYSVLKGMEGIGIDEEVKLTRSMRLQLARDHARNLAAQVEEWVNDASATERIPLFEILVRAGKKSLAVEADYPLNVIRSHLGYAADSIEEKALLAFLRVIPEHEISVTLAYLLSQAGQDKGSVRQIFEVFQTVGIKLGQLTSIWRIFGDAVAQETALLKDHARPMDKHEILEVLQETLTEEERGRIKHYKGILGSASLKTVVLVELVDGSEAVLMVQRPRVKEQIASNIRLLRAYLVELEKAGLNVMSAMLSSMIGALSAKLETEVLITNEAKNRDVIERLMATMQNEGDVRRRLGDWKIEVPRLVPGFPVRDNFMAMSVARGRPFDQLDPRDQAQVGPALAAAGLHMLFGAGQFDADRHRGNWLFDPETKTIYFIDFGQLEIFESRGAFANDDRLKIARFIQALGEGKARDLMTAALELSKNKNTASVDRAAVEKTLSTLLSGHESFVSKIADIVNALVTAGVELENKFTFGALKGLMVLFGEGYVSDAQFTQLLREEISHLMASKAPALLWGQLRRGFSQLLEETGLGHRDGVSNPKRRNFMAAPPDSI
jgi:predicted unusual protein kinase regulating ubiquinone biosynthesis (AarF/ABC1/UbiB family)